MARVSMHVTPFWRQCKHLYVSNFRKMTPRVWINEFSIFISIPIHLSPITQTLTQTMKKIKINIIVTVNYIVNLKKKKNCISSSTFLLKKNKIFPTFFSWRQKFCNSFKVTLKKHQCLKFSEPIKLLNKGNTHKMVVVADIFDILLNIS